MMSSVTIQIRRKGVITLPAELRRQYGLDEGDVCTLVDLGGGLFLLSPRVSKLAPLGDHVARLIAEEGATVEEILETLDQERETYYREHYLQA